MLQSDLQRVLDLQRSWDRTNTSKMRERGLLVRHQVADWLLDSRAQLASAIGIRAGDFLAEGSDGSGYKARVAWTRFASRQRSPKATGGLMAVLLWAFPPEDAVYLSLLQGIHDPDALRHGELVRRPLDELRRVRNWGRTVVENWAEERGDLVPLRLGETGEASLAQGYELGAIASIRYAGGAIPVDEQLRADALSFAGALGELYRADSSVVSSGSLSRPNIATFHRPATATPPTGIQLGTTVEARDVNSDERRTWTVVARLAADPAHGKLSIESPVAKALLGRETGDTITVTTPGGTKRYLIEHRSP